MISPMNVMSSPNKPDLVSLDQYYRVELPLLLHERDLNPYLTSSELSQLMKWKLSRGKWRPRLLDFVSSLEDSVVKSASEKAFKSLPNISNAVKELTILKGVGPTTASAVLADYAPDIALFMSDDVVQASVLPDMFKATYEAITKGNSMWNELPIASGTLYEWDPKSTYIHEPPYFKGMTMSPPGPHGVKDAYCLLNFGDSITSDHISPAGSIHKDSPAAKYLMERGVDKRDFNSYGSRRGNDEIMARGTFANIRKVNKHLKGDVGPKTVHIPSGEKLSVFDATLKYKNEGRDTIILAGAKYGSGSNASVKAVISKSFERIHRSNLVGMGIIPLCFKTGEDAPETLGLKGEELYTIELPNNVSEMKPGKDVTVVTNNGKSFTCTLRFDTEVELAYFNHGGLLQYVIRNLIKQ